MAMLKRATALLPRNRPRPLQHPQGSVRRYKGVRMRSKGRWASEVRIPRSRDKIWLGSYPSAEQAARAYDAAVYILRGATSAAFLNFPDSPPDLPTGLTSPRTIQATAAAVGHASTPSPAATRDDVQLFPETHRLPSSKPLEVTAPSPDRNLTSCASTNAHHQQLNLSSPASDSAGSPILPGQLTSEMPIGDDTIHIYFDNPFGTVEPDGFTATSAAVTVSERFDIDPSTSCADTCLWANLWHDLAWAN